MIKEINIFNAMSFYSHSRCETSPFMSQWQNQGLWNFLHLYFARYINFWHFIFFKLNATGKVCHPTVSVFVMYISDMCSAEFWSTHLTPHERAERVRVKRKGDCWKVLNCLHKCMEEGRLCPTILATAQLLVVCPGLIKASLHISGCKDLCFMTQRESFISLFLCPAAEAALWMWQPGSYHISFQGLLLMTQAFPVTVNQIQNRTRI